ncbi:MAG: ATP-binding protein [Pirellulaceae bacterium]
MQDYEKLGAFYLGREYDLAANKPKEDLVLYDSKDLTTHALCVGMTGSGKTGLCLALLEEAAIDGIPAIIIDPKGDLGNLLLTFPQLRPEDFAPYIDPAEATRTGISSEEYATKVAADWKQGLADWGQQPERIARLREAADVAIYTPGSSAGLPLTVLRSFTAPPQSTRDDAEAFRESISAAAASLLGLLGIEADPLRSREQILLSNILEKNWRDGKDLDIAGLIRAIQTPGFDKVGVMDLESFFPAKERFELSMQLNNLLASPGFSAWLEGESLNIQRLLYTPEGKPRLSVLSIAHLSDAERMFFVTILLSETIAWMRTQSGTSSLRALLYMDEVFGYFPPSKNPPSKTPMLTLLKQARAFGLGVVLATQNPVDLDYKGLANCGTWLLGRLQTERDKMRVLDGLEGASTQAGATFDRAKMEQILSGLGKRVFLMNNVHEDHPTVFQSRWALSYLRGPLTREQISTLMKDRKSAGAGSDAKGTSASGGTPTALRGRESGASSQERPVLPPDITERFLPLRASIPSGGKLVYRPALLGVAKVHFAQAASGVDVWKGLSLIVPVEAELAPDIWTAAEVSEDDAPELEAAPSSSAQFSSLPADLSRPKKYTELATALKDQLYRSQKCQLWKCPALKQVSKAGETEADFRIRLSHTGRETRDAQLEKLRQKYAPKITSLTEQIRKAAVRVEKEKSQSTQQMLGTALSFGSTILSAFMGRKLTSVSNINKASSAMKNAGKVFREQQDVSQAGETVEAYKERLANLDAEFKAEAEKIQLGFDADQLQLEEVAIQPKKSDITVSQVLLLWEPWVVAADGTMKQGA